MTTPSIRNVPSRDTLRLSIRSRRSSLATDHDVFADDQELDSPVTIDDAPLGFFPPPRQHFPDNPFSDPPTTNVAPDSSIAGPSTDRSSTAKNRLMIDDVPSPANGLGRSLSTSSRITLPRSQSPYNGPTAPSHPYNMYPQLTRASSVASQSTLRPGSETPFFPSRGPEHPYQLYPQNTVDEEAEDITTHGMPLGFPRSNFQPSSGASSSDVGDIIGSDGHIEQLPPYTRYADNTVAKGNMDDVRSVRRSSRATTYNTDTVTNAAPISNVDSVEPLQPREQFEEETEAQRARKEGYRGSWRDTAMKPTIAGLPLWGLITIIIIVIISAVVGGVVGGIIGDKQGAQRAYAMGATTTLYLDADPTTLGPNSSPLPTGHFQIPFNQSYEINECIPNPDEIGAAWGCMDIAYIGVNVFDDESTGTTQATFEDFSTNTQNFRYGPQPPDFNASAFTLQPMVDKDANDLGVAMFFSVLFDKLSIVPEWAIDEGLSKRSINADYLKRRTAIYDGDPLQPSDRPWFCFWNSTINEFFVYLNEDAHPPPTTSTQNKLATHTTSSSTITPAPVSSSIGLSAASGLAMKDSVAATSSTQSATTFQAYNPIYNPVESTTTPIPNKRRSYETSAANMTNYPKLIKMVEKRKPADPNTLHVQPYCQMMQVLDSWEIVPIPTVETVCIEEKQYVTSTATGINDKRRRKRRRDEDRDVIGDLESYCICEWTSQ